MALLSLFHNCITGKSNGVFINNAKTTNLSNAIKYFTFNKPIILLIIKIYYEIAEVSIQHISYLRIVENLKTFI